MLKLDPVPKIITFDCYGTLDQRHRALRQSARMILGAHHESVSQEQVAALTGRVREIATELQQLLS